MEPRDGSSFRFSHISSKKTAHQRCFHRHYALCIMHYELIWNSGTVPRSPKLLSHSAHAEYFTLGEAQYFTCPKDIFHIERLAVQYFIAAFRNDISECCSPVQFNGIRHVIQVVVFLAELIDLPDQFLIRGVFNQVDIRAL